MLARLRRGDGLEFVGEKDFDQDAETFFSVLRRDHREGSFFP